MTLPQALKFLRPGDTIRRLAWPDLRLHLDYIEMYLVRTYADGPVSGPYPLSIDDMRADDWVIVIVDDTRLLMFGD